MATKYRRVTYSDRCQIHAFLQVKVSVSRISKELGFHKSTIYREISRNGIVPQLAEARSGLRRKVCRRPFLITGEVEGQVLAQLFSDLSPEQISRRLALEKIAQVSHQTIYHYVYRNRRALKPYLRRFNRRGTSRIRMKAHKALHKQSIDLRPRQANERLRIGDWERDGMYGANRQQLLVCTDRKSRYTKIGRMKAYSVLKVNKLTNTLLKRTRRRVHTITNDNGPEFRYGTGAIAPVYYCHPGKPQQRGTVENTVGLLRQYIKRKTNLETLTDKDLQDMRT